MRLNENVKKGGKHSNKKSGKKIITIAIFLVIISIITFIFVLIKELKIFNNKDNNKINVVVNYTDVTTSMKQGIFIDEKENIYLGMEDLRNYYDDYIYYDEKYNQIITTFDDKIAVINIENSEKEVNGKREELTAEIKKVDNEIYLPFLELEDIYDVKTYYYAETNTVVLESKNKTKETAKSKEKNSVKSNPTFFSRTVDKIEKGEEIVIVPINSNENEQNNNGYIKVRTNRGKLGYIKENSIQDKTNIKMQVVENEQIKGKVSLVWDYFSEYISAPDRKDENINGINVVSPSFFYLEKLGKGNLLENVNASGEEYISWAHSKGYKVWPIISNDSMKETTSEIMNDYMLRKKLINQILDYVEKYNLDGVNIDFENMKEEDKDLFSRFIIELTPRLKEKGKVISIDVTAPDGAPEWSLCFDRNCIGQVVDYMIFMAYDEYNRKFRNCWN